jgi:hypothetical protein
MQLSLTIGAMAVVLGVVLATGYAIGEDATQGTQAREAVPQKEGPARSGAWVPERSGGA